MKSWQLGMVGMLFSLGAAKAMEPPAPVSPERLQKLIAQLGDGKFQVRKQASEELSRHGRAAVLALKEAAANHKDPEVRKLAGALVEEIEARDRPRAALLIVLARFLEAKPAPSDRQVAVALHLLSLSRAATEAEVDAAEKRLKAAKDRNAEAEALMYALLCGRDFNARLAEVNMKVVELKQKVDGAPPAEKFGRLNGEEFQKGLKEIARGMRSALEKRSDADLLDATFLVVLRRFPKAEENTSALAHLKKVDNRERFVEDLVWALMNTKEFLMGN